MPTAIKKKHVHNLAWGLGSSGAAAIAAGLLLRHGDLRPWEDGLLAGCALVLGFAGLRVARAILGIAMAPRTAKAAAEALKEAVALAHAEHVRALAEDEARAARLQVELQAAAELSEVEAETTASPDSVDAAPAWANAMADHRVLIVDDNAINRKILETILDRFEVEWMSVEDGQQAVDAVCQRMFAAVLMDIQMPVMDGLSATREIRRMEVEAGRALVPIIIVSAHNEAEDVAAGRAAGAQRHLGKPISVQALIGALNGVQAGAAEAA